MTEGDFMKRDSSVELSRILGSLIVIGVHVCLPSFTEWGCDRSRLFISCLVADGVAVFWIITGFFYFNNTYSKIGHKTLKKIGIPMLVFSVLSFYLSGWLLNDLTLLQSIRHTKEEYINIFKTLLTWNNPVPAGSHLWYLYTYILLVVIFPILKSFIDYLEAKPEKRIKAYLIMSFVFLVINDAASNQLADFSLKSVSALLPASIEVTYGYFLYKNKEFFCRKRWIILAPAIFLTVNIVRMMIQIKRYAGNLGENSILFWFSSLGVICAACIVIFGFALDSCIKSTGVKTWICRIASYTMLIYIVHTYVNAFLGKYGVTEKINVYLLEHVPYVTYDFIYVVVFTVLVFVISLAAAIIIRMISGGAAKVFAHKSKQFF